MPTEDIQTGYDGKAYVKPDGGSTFIEMDVFKWDGTFTGNSKDVSGSKSGRKRIRGMPDASGTMGLHYDAANLPMDDTPTTGPNLRPGALVNLDLVPDGATSGGTSGYRLLAIIDDVKPSVEVDGDNNYDVSWSLADGLSLKFPGDV